MLEQTFLHEETAAGLMQHPGTLALANIRIKEKTIKQSRNRSNCNYLQLDNILVL